MTHPLFQNLTKNDIQEILSGDNVHFNLIETGKYFTASVTRSGSPFSDWYYIYPENSEFIEVKRATKTIEYWELIQ